MPARPIRPDEVPTLQAAADLDPYLRAINKQLAEPAWRARELQNGRHIRLPVILGADRDMTLRQLQKLYEADGWWVTETTETTERLGDSAGRNFAIMPCWLMRPKES
jgi:hypothetical protein